MNCLTVSKPLGKSPQRLRLLSQPGHRWGAELCGGVQVRMHGEHLQQGLSSASPSDLLPHLPSNTETPGHQSCLASLGETKLNLQLHTVFR